jgi:nitrate/nitrite transport system substrate-binding protein
MSLTALKIAFLPLTDCAPLVVAVERGLFKQFGLDVTLDRAASWTAARERLESGACQAAHLLFGVPFATALGHFGPKAQPLVIPWILSRNGQAITLAAKYRGRIAADAKALLKEVHERRDAGRPVTFAHTLAPGTHALWLRTWLAAGGINPDHDIALITIPPPQMVANLRHGQLDGFSVGEPWNARAAAEGLGYTAVTSQQIWPDHPEKILAFTEKFTAAQPATVTAALAALHLAGQWCDDPANHAGLAQLLSAAAYIGCPAEQILPRLSGTYDLGDGRTVTADAHPVTFSRRDANHPQPRYAAWWLSQLRRWAMTLGAPDYTALTARLMRPDLYAAALALNDAKVGPVNLAPEKFFDGTTFDPTDPEKFARAHSIHTARF